MRHAPEGKAQAGGGAVLKKIVSGGQTGVDRAALDAALEAGLPCGGWCPAGRRAEDGKIPAEYPLKETRGEGYEERTEKNVLDSDATLVLTSGEPEGGTLLTVEYARENKRPCLVVDIEKDAGEAPERIAAWLLSRDIEVLNVAGPRASKNPLIYAAARDVICRILRKR